MERDRSLPDGLPSAALVERMVREIDLSSDQHRDLLLFDLLCAAWGTLEAQNQ